MNPSSSGEPKESEFKKELKFLQEDQKISFVLDMLRNIKYGKLEIEKYNGKIVGYQFNGNVKFMIPEFERAKKGQGDGNS